MTTGVMDRRDREGRREGPIFSPALLKMMMALCVTALAIAAFGRWTGIGVQKLPDVPVVEFRDLTFQDGSRGLIEVRDTADGSIVKHIQPGEAGFLRTVMRGLAHERMARGGDSSEPFRLALRKDGSLVIRDSRTQREVILDSFGKPNRDVFAVLLKSGGGAGPQVMHPPAAGAAFRNKGETQ